MPPEHFSRADSAKSLSTQCPQPTPNRPIRSEDVPFVTWQHGERFAGRKASLSKRGGGTKVGFHLEELPPNKQSCPFHFHLLEEEHFYIVNGQCVLRSGDERFTMNPGDYVCFPPGTGVAHCFENPFSAPCRILVVGDRDPNETPVYPDSGKMKLRRQKTIIPWPNRHMDYWEGEPTEEILALAHE